MSSIKSSKKLANIPARASSGPPEPRRFSQVASCTDVPRLAVRCDGRVLLSLTDLENVDFAGRDLWVGLVLTDDEASEIHRRLNLEEAASPVVARLRALDKERKKAGAENDTDDDGSGNGSGDQ